MKNVRLFYKKKGRMRFVSHLDMVRFMTRIIRKSRLNVWYTEGFNPHLYMNFALPLSLGQESDCEIVDIRLLDDSIEVSSVLDVLNPICREQIEFYDAIEAVTKLSLVSFARYQISFDDGGALCDSLKNFFEADSLICLKKTKKGDIKPLDIASKIRDLEISANSGNTVLSLTLPAGSRENINPELPLKAFFESESNEYYCYSILRTAILDENLKDFR